MKNYLSVIATICLIAIAGSVAYYYLYFLPQHDIQNQQDINAIRKVIAPTPEQQQIQQQQAAQQEAEFKKKESDYLTCIKTMFKKQSDWLDKQCPSGSMDLLKIMDCRSKAMNTPEARQFDCTF